MGKQSKKGGSKQGQKNFNKLIKERAAEKKAKKAAANAQHGTAKSGETGKSAKSDTQTQQQARAAFALKKVQSALKDLNGKPRKEFKAHASAFPAMIQMNGLGQAAAFYLSKSDRHEVLYNILSGWLTRDGQPYLGKADLLDGVTSEGLPKYLVAQAEALAFLDWVKKFANAYVRD